VEAIGFPHNSGCKIPRFGAKTNPHARDMVWRKMGTFLIFYSMEPVRLPGKPRIALSVVVRPGPNLIPEQCECSALFDV
jgi:hypothetical protein